MEDWLKQNPQASEIVQQGLEEARNRQFVQGPDLDADNEKYCNGHDEEGQECDDTQNVSGQ